MLISFFESYVRMDNALTALKRGGQYPGDLRASFDLAWKVLRTHEIEVVKIIEAMKKEQEVERV
jgi:hypothetical protein